MTPEQFAEHYPKLYHMAEEGTWESIKGKGLYCTTALLDLFGITGSARIDIESKRRPESVTLNHEEHGTVVIRDNKPIHDSKLKLCLEGMAIHEWYETLNKHVFFWTTKKRLLTLMNAAAYRNKKHTVITVNTLSFLRKYQENAVLSRINSGAIFCPSPRGIDTFQPFSKWLGDIRPIARDLKYPVAEVAVQYHIPDIADFTIRVDEMQGNRKLHTIWEG